MSGHLTKRQTGSDSPRNVRSLSECDGNRFAMIYGEVLTRPKFYKGKSLPFLPIEDRFYGSCATNGQESSIDKGIRQRYRVASCGFL
jgi:hypothetical protein